MPSRKAYIGRMPNTNHRHHRSDLVRIAIQAMLERGLDVFYYITVMNENYAQHDLPVEARAGVLRGCYRFVPTVKNWRDRIKPAASRRDRKSVV